MIATTSQDRARESQLIEALCQEFLEAQLGRECCEALGRRALEVLGRRVLLQIPF